MPRSKLPPDDNNPADIQLQIRMPPALHDRLRRKAFKERRSLAAVARLCIEQCLKAKRREAAP